MLIPDRSPSGRIDVLANGPYQVGGGLPLLRALIISDARGDPVSWIVGEPYLASKTYRLCRCGHSRMWPICDATHGSVGFDGGETDSRVPYIERAEVIDGPALRLTDVRILCSNAGFCTREGGTWRLTSQSADPHARRLAIEQAGNCPSGRLVAWETNGEVIEPVLSPSVCVIQNPRIGIRGPLWVRGRIAVYSAAGVRYEKRNRLTLCGCGLSHNKPFCDGKHQDH